MVRPPRRLQRSPVIGRSLRSSATPSAPAGQCYLVARSRSFRTNDGGPTIMLYRQCQMRNGRGLRACFKLERGADRELLLLGAPETPYLPCYGHRSRLSMWRKGRGPKRGRLPVTPLDPRLLLIGEADHCRRPNHPPTAANPPPSGPGQSKLRGL